MGFLRAGLFCFGGGPASIPFIHQEVVTRYKWMTDEEFTEVVAIANTLPGPINTKLSGYIGLRVGGILGLLVSISAMILPTCIMMIVLLTTFAQFADQPWARGMTRAMLPVIGVMLGIMGWQFLVLATKGLGWIITIAHIVVVAVLIGFLNVHPAIIIVGLLLWALFGHKIIAPKKASAEQQGLEGNTSIENKADDSLSENKKGSDS